MNLNRRSIIHTLHKTKCFKLSLYDIILCNTRHSTKDTDGNLFRSVFNFYTALPANLHLQRNRSFMRLWPRADFSWDARQASAFVVLFQAILLTKKENQKGRYTRYANWCIRRCCRRHKQYKWAKFLRVAHQQLNQCTEPNHLREVCYWFDRFTRDPPVREIRQALELYPTVHIEPVFCCNNPHTCTEINVITPGKTTCAI